jgi:colanic acid/amylovoran biosynthesis glycosyltransferase
VSALPAVGHVNYSFFASTQSFIYHYLVAIRRFRSVCLTRTPEADTIRGQVPPELDGDLYAYDPAGGRRASVWSAGLSARRIATRLPPRVAGPVFDFASRRIAPRLRADADPEDYVSWAEGILRERGASVIHAYFGPVGWRALELRRRLGIPLVVTSLGDDMAPTVAPWWWWWIQEGRETPDWPARLRELFAEGDLFLAEGPHLRQQLIEYGCPPEKAQLHRMALPLDRLPYRERRPRDGGRPVIFFAGRFCAQKGVLYALEAANELRREGRDFEFRLAGDDTMTDGSYAAQVHAYIRANDMHDRVRLLGWLNNDECLREMDAADIFLHPSVVDDDGRGEGGAPTSILEAQAMGMPVVSTLHCDIPYVTRPGESALLAPERDGPALAHALRTLLDDQDRWVEMGRAGRAHMEERHDINREAERLEERYLGLIGAPARGDGSLAAPAP